MQEFKEVTADEALMHALENVGPERIWQVPHSATIKLAEGTGPLLAGAVIAAWAD